MPAPNSRRSLGLTSAAAVVLTFAFSLPAHAQYFGQNKVQYERFHFQVLKTDHFDIYFYPEEKDAAAQVARMAERWHDRLSRTLSHVLSGRQAVMLYADHPDFEQTNVIEGTLGEGTGGVTESARRRVVLPMAATLADTDHVLGHELVHAFQYDILGRMAGAPPLWFIEGMAEYLSLGPRDVQTSMWMRDAAITERLPKIKDLDDPRYFPYRFGHAFWAFVGGRWGDSIAGTLLRTVAGDAENGPVPGDVLGALKFVTGRPVDALSDEWHAAVLSTYAALGPVAVAPPAAGPVIGERKGGGQLNVGPALSPDGTRIAFLSSRELLSVNLYLSDVATGRIIRKLIETSADPHFDSLQFLGSAGTWDPTGHRLAIAGVRAGHPVLALVDVDRGGVDREIPFKDLGEIFHPAWAPDGKSIAFSAQVGGYTDLFVVDLATEKTTRLTEDAYADLQPAWSPDGRRLAFVTDRFTADLASLAFRGYSLATVAADTRQIERLDVGLGGKVMNPQWSGDARSVFFLADAGGRQDAYRFDFASRQLSRLTDAVTGVAGVTPLSPALSVTARGDRAAISVFRDGGYEIHVVEIGAASDVVTADMLASKDAALLPPAQRDPSLVAQQLAQPTEGLPAAPQTEPEPYSPKLSLIGVSQQIGFSTGGFGTFAGGGISLLFSDELGEHLLSTGIAANGGVKDVAGQVAYINRQSRWQWSLIGERSPFVTGSARRGVGNLNGQPVIVDTFERFRVTETQAGAMTAYPLSRATRVEFGAGYRHIGFSHEIEQEIFDPSTGVLIDREITNVPTSAPLAMGRFSTAIVRDTAVFGATSPIRGALGRVEFAPSIGGLTMNEVSVDYRRYVMPVRPITFAARVLHFGRYGQSSEDARLTPLFIGYSTLVRGYDVGTFQANECGLVAGECPAFDRLVGSRMLVTNFEMRAPAVGLFTGKLDYGPLPVELFAFMDGGVAWSKADKPGFAGGSREWVTSVGGGARVNLLGFVIAEFNLARPISRGNRGWLFVFNLRPGF